VSTGTRSRFLLVGLVVVAAALTAGWVIASRPAADHRYDIHPGEDLFGRLKRLKAGDEVVIHAGTYRTPGFYEVTWRGTSEEGIVVRGASGEARPVIVGIPSQNILDVEGSHFRLAHLELRGGSHGVRLANVDHATLEDLVLHGLGDVGISCNRPGDVCDAVAIRGSDIYDTGHHGTGEGIYLGCQDGGCAFERGVVERNFVHDTGGTQGDGIELKPGSLGNEIRHNTVERTRGAGILIAGRPISRRNRVVDAGRGG
jgi:hypothetical protein